MGIIQKQALKSSVFLLIGFGIGGINILFLFPKLTSLDVNGLTRAFLDVGTVLSLLATLGTLPIVYKFSPFYRTHLEKKDNDLPFVTGLICLGGFILIYAGGFFFRDFIIRKLGKAPLFAENFNLVYPLTFFMLAYAWMESFAWALKKSVHSNFLKETLIRILTTMLILALWFGLISTQEFIDLFCFLYVIPVIALFMILRRTGEWNFTMRISKVTLRLKNKMFTFGLFVFGATFLNIASRTVDSFVVLGLKGLAATAVFLLGSYLASLMDLPLRSINSIATPVIAESWREKNYKNIETIYEKSTVTLLVAALFIFNLVMLNVNNLSVFLGENFAEVPIIVLIMGLAKIIDLGSGVNGQIIATSSNWKFDFYTNVLLTLLAFPLNFILITRIGIVGGAVATLISVFIFNLTRYIFIFRKYGWQPYGFPHVKILLVSIIIFLAVYAVPFISNIYADSVFRTVLFSALFVPAILGMNVSEEFNSTAGKIMKKMRLKRK
ncbi:MAG: polysaccharide biosynthesis C-terminal domain-containing protein [Ferruginibacter sp.]